MINESEETYFFIDFDVLGEDTIFPFHLFIFNPQSELYTAYLYANSPLTEEKAKFLWYIIGKGGELAIQYSQKNTFLANRGLDEKDIESLQEPEIHDLVQRRDKLLKQKRDREESEGKFHFAHEFSKAIEEDNFIPLIKAARDEGMLLPYTLSSTVSLGAYLAETLLIEDNFINRIVALSFHLSKQMGMKDPLALGEIITAAYFSHLGQTQLDLRYSHKGQMEFTDKEKKKYKQHPGLSGHLIRKSAIDISDRCNRIIYQHHERFDGNGYPENKKGAFIEPLALVLGASAHILEYHEGKISGTKTSIKVIINNLKNKSAVAGLEFEFGDTLFETIIHLLGTEEVQRAA